MTESQKMNLSEKVASVYLPLESYLISRKPAGYNPASQASGAGSLEKAALDGAYAAGFEQALAVIREIAEYKSKPKMEE